MSSIAHEETVFFRQTFTWVVAALDLQHLWLTTFTAFVSSWYSLGPTLSQGVDKIFNAVFSSWQVPTSCIVATIYPTDGGERFSKQNHCHHTRSHFNIRSRHQIIVLGYYTCSAHPVAYENHILSILVHNSAAFLHSLFLGFGGVGGLCFIWSFTCLCEAGCMSVRVLICVLFGMYLLLHTPDLPGAGTYQAPPPKWITLLDTHCALWVF